MPARPDAEPRRRVFRFTPLRLLAAAPMVVIGAILGAAGTWLVITSVGPFGQSARTDDDFEDIFALGLWFGVVAVVVAVVFLIAAVLLTVERRLRPVWALLLALGVTASVAGLVDLHGGDSPPMTWRDALLFLPWAYLVTVAAVRLASSGSSAGPSRR